MKKSIMSKRGRRFDEGGFISSESQEMPRARTAKDDQEAADKAAGLEASNKEKSTGFFERLRMGNIDDPNSEAYKRFGAGRGRAERIPVEDKSFTDVPSKIVSRDEGMGAFNQRLQASKDADTGITEGERIAQEMASKPDQVVEPTKVVKKPVPRDTSNYSNEGRYRSPVGVSTVKDTSNYSNEGRGKEAPSAKTEAKTEASPTKKMEEDMRNYKPRYTPPGSAPKTTTQKHPPKVSIPERPDNSFPGSKYKLGGSVSKASSRADGIAQRGKTRGKMC
jgi:hypothetical protein